VKSIWRYHPTREKLSISNYTEKVKITNYTKKAKTLKKARISIRRSLSVVVSS
jgi:hypothetical protein